VTRRRLQRCRCRHHRRCHRRWRWSRRCPAPRVPAKASRCLASPSPSSSPPPPPPPPLTFLPQPAHRRPRARPSRPPALPGAEALAAHGTAASTSFQINRPRRRQHPTGCIRSPRSTFSRREDERAFPAAFPTTRASRDRRARERTIDRADS